MFEDTEKGLSEAVFRKTDNIPAFRKGQTMINNNKKTTHTHRNLKIEQHDPDNKPGINSCAPKVRADFDVLLAPVVLLLLQTR